MKKPAKVKNPLIIIILRHIGALLCLGMGIFILMGNTNSLVGVCMAFYCAIIISPFLDSILHLFNLKFLTSFKAVLVIIEVILDIITTSMKFGLFINIAAILVLTIILIILSNIGNKKEVIINNEKQPIIEEVKEDTEIEKPKGFSIFEDVEEPKKKTSYIRLLNTHEEMMEYCVNHRYGQGIDIATGIRHFMLIQAALQPTEKILTCFVGYHNYVSVEQNDGYYAYAITSKRLLFAQKRLDSQNIQAVSLVRILDAKALSREPMGILRIITRTQQLNIGMDVDTSRKIRARIHRFIQEITRLKQEVINKEVD